jgi:hypothetical protein
MAGEAVAFVTVGPRASRIWIYLVHSGGRQLHAADAEQMMSLRAAHSGHMITQLGRFRRISTEKGCKDQQYPLFNGIEGSCNLFKAGSGKTYQKKFSYVQRTEKTQRPVTDVSGVKPHIIVDHTGSQ